MSYQKTIIFFSSLLIISCNKKSNSYLGYVDDNPVYIATEQSGTISEVHVKKGDVIKTGDLLYKLDTSGDELQLEALNASLNKINSQLASLNADLDAATSNENNLQDQVARVTELYNSGAVSLQQFENLKNSYNSAKERVKSLKSQIGEGAKKSKNGNADWQQIKAQIELLQYNISKKIKKSPIDAIVQDVYFKTGEVTLTGGIVVSLVSENDRQIEFYVPESDITKIQVGANVEAAADGLAEKIKANVVYISSQAEFTPPQIFSEDSRQKFVYKVLANPDAASLKKLKGGLILNVSAN